MIFYLKFPIIFQFKEGFYFNLRIFLTDLKKINIFNNKKLTFHIEKES